MPHRLRGPGSSLVCVAGRAWIRDFIFVRHGRRDERKRVRAHKDAGNRDLDLRHVTCHAFAARGAVLMMCMGGKRRRAGPVPRAGTVAIEANLVHGLSQLRVVLRAVHIVAVEARDPAPVHDALREVVPLHPVLVRRAVRKMCEAQLTQCVLFELPVIPQVQPHVITHRPVVVLSFDWIGERAPLRVALDARVAALDVVHARRIQNVAARGMLHMGAARPVAALAANVPLRHLLGLNVVVDRVAAVARRPRGPLHVVGRVERHPPVRAGCHHVGTPHLVGDVPLRRLGIIVVADFREVALFPDTPIDERHLILRELRTDIVGGQIGSNGVGMFFGIAHDVGHRRLLPMLVDLRVAFLARCGTDVVRRIRRCCLLGLLLGRQLRYGANEEDNFPGGVVVFSGVRIPQRRHPREPHATLDDVVDFAVSKILRRRRAQIRCLGIKVLADFRLRVAILAVATRAVVGEEFSRFLQAFLSGCKRIFFVTRAARNPPIPYRARHYCFHSGRLIGRAESSPDHRCPVHRHKNRNGEQDQKNSVLALHIRLGLRLTVALAHSSLANQPE